MRKNILWMLTCGLYEQSFADSWSNELGVWMCDRFSRNLYTNGPKDFFVKNI